MDLSCSGGGGEGGIRPVLERADNCDLSFILWN